MTPNIWEKSPVIQSESELRAQNSQMMQDLYLGVTYGNGYFQEKADEYAYRQYFANLPLQEKIAHDVPLPYVFNGVQFADNLIDGNYGKALDNVNGMAQETVFLILAQRAISLSVKTSASTKSINLNTTKSPSSAIVGPVPCTTTSAGGGMRIRLPSFQERLQSENGSIINPFASDGLRIVRGDGLYVLRDENNIIRYVGKGDVEARLWEHSITPNKRKLTPQVIWDTGELSQAEAFALEGRLMGRLGGPQSVNLNTMLLNMNKSFSKDNWMLSEIRGALSGSGGNELWIETMRRLRKGGE